VIFMSAAFRNMAEPCADVPLIRKPFNLQELLDRVRMALGISAPESGRSPGREARR
jgi:hypothetical protein